ncbi:hypothetical protein V5O48_015889 [Marasmius crinis-equi]|uniref:Arylamine N-acetyltransferase n=1 Tax=Marasmius crinis-equi TaxID=585013 RepID=A0ABR3ET90_9AGAR
MTGTLTNGRWIKKMPSTYSKSQVLEWLSYIGYDVTPAVEKSLENETFPANLDNLTIIQRLHLIAVPFENTSMHYSAAQTMNVEPQAVFQRLIKDKHGSYCFGKTGLLFGMLRGLGYRVCAVQGRINRRYMIPGAEPDFTPQTHMVLLVQPIADSNATYMVDVGFGGSGIVRPLLLSDTEDNVITGTTPSEKHRLRKGSLPGTSIDYWVWKLECLHVKQNDPSSEDESRWKWLFAFDEIERFPQDVDCSNHYVATRGSGTIFSNNVICNKYFWLDEAQLQKPNEERFMGTISLLGGTIRRTMGARSEVVKELRSEEERIVAIKEYFGIDVDEDGLQHIKGKKAALEGY